MKKYLKLVLCGKVREVLHCGKVSKSGTLLKGISKWYSVKKYLKVELCGKVPKSGILWKSI